MSENVYLGDKWNKIIIIIYLFFLGGGQIIFEGRVWLSAASDVYVTEITSTVGKSNFFVNPKNLVFWMLQDKKIPKLRQYLNPNKTV